MMRRETRGGDLNLIRVLRHDLSDKPTQTIMYIPRRIVVMVLTAIAAVLTVIQMLSY
jgi:hypothetical protein